VDLDRQTPDPALQRMLDEWLAAGRVKLADFLPSVAEQGGPSDSLNAATAGMADEAEYQQRFRHQLQAARSRGAASSAGPDGVELLRTAGHSARAAALLASAQHSVALLLPRLDEHTAGEAVRREVQTLAARGVLTLVGWGSADEQEQELARPAPVVVDALHRLVTPEGLPAAPVWWIGGQYGQDVLMDRHTLVSTLPNVLIYQDQPIAAGVSTYVVTAEDLVRQALEDLEPSFARAARLSWHAAVRSPLSARQALERCCVTWVLIRCDDCGRKVASLGRISASAMSSPSSLKATARQTSPANAGFRSLKRDFLHIDT
jgi:hypothetical protein